MLACLQFQKLALNSKVRLSKPQIEPFSFSQLQIETKSCVANLG